MEIKQCGNCHKTNIFDNIKFTIKGKIHKFYGKDICVKCIDIVKAIVKADPYYTLKASYKDGLETHKLTATRPSIPSHRK